VPLAATRAVAEPIGIQARGFPGVGLVWPADRFDIFQVSDRPAGRSCQAADL